MHGFRSEIIGLVLVAVMAVCTSATAQEGKLKYVRCETDSALAPLFHELKGEDFKKASGQKGLVSRNALVCELKTGGRTIMIALDSSGSPREFDTIRIDLTGKGQFDSRGCFKLNLRKEDGSKFANFAETIEIKLDGKDVPLVVAGNYSCMSFVGEPTYSLQISFYLAADGKCSFGSKTYPVRIIDATGRMELGNAAGTKLDASRAGPPIDGDTVIVDMEDGSFAKGVVMGLYGMPLRVDEKWYDVKLSADKAAITAKQIDVPAGRIKIPHDKWSCIMLGKKYLMRISGTREPAFLPVDNYQIVSFTEYGPADAGGREPLIDYNFAADAAAGSVKTVEITKNLETNFPTGTPLTAEVSIDNSTNTQLKFGACLKDSMELSPKLIICEGGRPIQPPYLIIVGSGKELHKGPMQANGDGTFSCTWDIPAGTRGKMTAKAEFLADPFKVESKELKFDLK